MLKFLFIVNVFVILMKQWYSINRKNIKIKTKYQLKLKSFKLSNKKMHVFQYLFSYPLGICMFGVSFLVSKSFFHQISGIFVQELDQTKNMLPFKNQACKQSLPIHLFLKQFSSIPLNVVGF